MKIFLWILALMLTAVNLWAAATRPFTLSGTLEEALSVELGSSYRVGNSLFLRTWDPSLKSHLDSFLGHQVTVEVK